MHPELFELKALVAGRLDLHRRREIDDHLGSCADCSRHYVALMLGSASPKTAEAEARSSLVSSGATSVMAIAAGAVAPPAFGIDAPLTPSPRPAPKPAAPAQSVPLDVDLSPSATRVPMPVSPSLVDAITRLRAETEAAKPADAAKADASSGVVLDSPSPVADARPRLAPEIIAPQDASSSILTPSIFTPTPYDGVSVIHPPAPPAPQAAPELVVTFPSAPLRTSRRSPASQPATIPGAPAPVATVVTSPSPEYVSLAVPTLASQPASAFEITTPSTPLSATKAPGKNGLMAAAAVAALVIGISGYKVFRSSVDKAATAAAAEAAKKVEAAARTSATTATPVQAAPAAPAKVETRIVYVERPSSRKGGKSETRPETVVVAPTVPIAVTLPEVNLNTGTEGAAQTNTQRAAANELTRSARATAIRTAAPRP